MRQESMKYGKEIRIAMKNNNVAELKKISLYEDMTNNDLQDFCLYACISSNTEIVNYLLNERNIELPEFLLSFAINNNQYDIVQLLINRDDISFEETDNQTAVKLALKKKDHQMIYILFSDKRVRFYLENNCNSEIFEQALKIHMKYNIKKF